MHNCIKFIKMMWSYKKIVHIYKNKYINNSKYDDAAHAVNDRPHLVDDDDAGVAGLMCLGLFKFYVKKYSNYFRVCVCDVIKQNYSAKNRADHFGVLM